MDKVVSRQGLLGLMQRRDSLVSGLNLLRSKRHALMKELYGLMEEVVSKREELSKLTHKAYRDLQLARGFAGEALESAAIASGREVSIEIKTKNIWGISIPEIPESPVAREARDISPIGDGIGVFEVAAGFEKVVAAVIKMASKEIRLDRIADAIKTETRRINAIEELILPRIRARMKEIEKTLEEREREEVFRLKRFKARRRT